MFDLRPMSEGVGCRCCDRLLAPDLIMVDHRPIGLGTMDQ